MAFYRALDGNQDSEALAQFAEDAAWHRKTPARGHAAIADALRKRSATRRVRHVITNISVLYDDVGETPECAVLHAYVTVYEADPGEVTQEPLEMPVPKLLGRVQMALKQAGTGTGWLIRDLRTTTDFAKHTG